MIYTVTCSESREKGFSFNRKGVVSSPLPSIYSVDSVLGYAFFESYDNFILDPLSPTGCYHTSAAQLCCSAAFGQVQYQRTN